MSLYSTYNSGPVVVLQPPSPAVAQLVSRAAAGALNKADDPTTYGTTIEVVQPVSQAQIWGALGFVFVLGAVAGYVGRGA